MLTTSDVRGDVWLRACISMQLDDRRRVHTGEVFFVDPLTAQQLLQSGRAVLAEKPERPPSSCSTRRDQLWKAGIP